MNEKEGLMIDFEFEESETVKKAKEKERLKFFDKAIKKNFELDEDDEK